MSCTRQSTEPSARHGSRLGVQLRHAPAGVSIGVAAVALDVLAPLNQRCAYALLSCHETSASYSPSRECSAMFEVFIFRDLLVKNCVAMGCIQYCRCAADGRTAFWAADVPVKTFNVQLSRAVTIRTQIDAEHAFTFCDRWIRESLEMRCIHATALPRCHLF